jgi:hypothetical protein
MKMKKLLLIVFCISFAVIIMAQNDTMKIDSVNELIEIDNPLNIFTHRFYFMKNDTAFACWVNFDQRDVGYIVDKKDTIWNIVKLLKINDKIWLDLYADKFNKFDTIIKAIRFKHSKTTQFFIENNSTIFYANFALTPKIWETYTSRKNGCKQIMTPLCVFVYWESKTKRQRENSYKRYIKYRDYYLKFYR